MDRPCGPLPSPGPEVPPDPAPTETQTTLHAPYLWAVLIARIYEILALICPECTSAMRLIACVNEPEPVQRILLHIGEPAIPPPISPARSPAVWDTTDWSQTPASGSAMGEPAPEFQ